MKRTVEAPKETSIKSPEAPKTQEREFGDIIEKMVERMARQWKNQVLHDFNKSTIEKFADAQTGNFAKILLSMAKRVKKKLLSQYDDSRIESMSNQFTGKVDKRNQKELYGKLERKIGISRDELEATEGLTFQINAYKLETSQWVKKLRDETLEDWTSNTLRLMADGKGLPEILSQFDGMVEKRKNHAKMVARTQIASFNSLTTKARAQNLGLTKAVWVTSQDERVRRSHATRNGKEFDLSEGLYSAQDGKTLLPGTDYQCRCDYRILIPGMEDEE